MTEWLMNHFQIIVVIETLWNVNSIAVYDLLEQAFRCNRDIVECK